MCGVRLGQCLDRNPGGMAGIAEKIIKSTLRDLKSKSSHKRLEARLFLHCQGFEKICEDLKLNSDWIRREYLT